MVTAAKTVLEYRLGWARTYLKKYGLLTNSERGIWALTAEGLKTKRVDTSDVRNSVRKQVRRKRKVRRREEPHDHAEADATPELTNDAFDDPVLGDETNKSEDWRSELRRLLLDISPEAFERLCQRLLRESGFIQVEVST